MEYTVRELRSKIKEALDLANEGNQVTVTRGSDRFTLAREQRSSIKKVVYKIDTPVEKEKVDTKTPLTLDEIRDEINYRKAKLGEPNTMNQDPDYWADRRNKEAEIQKLWNKYNEIK